MDKNLSIIDNQPFRVILKIPSLNASFLFTRVALQKSLSSVYRYQDEIKRNKLAVITDRSR